MLDEFLFPGTDPGRPINNESLFYPTKRLTGGAATTHGFRSSPSDWCGDHGVERSSSRGHGPSPWRSPSP
jgi:hypothetical protein